MELVFDLLDTGSRDAAQVMRKTFTEQGGTIGRNAACEWALVDSTRSVSNYHAHISYRDGTFFFTDTSTNGTTVIPEQGEPRIIKKAFTPLTGRGILLFGRPLNNDRRGGMRYEVR